MQVTRVAPGWPVQSLMHRRRVMADRITYVGLDVHKESIVVAVAGENAAVPRRRTCQRICIRRSSREYGRRCRERFALLRCHEFGGPAYRPRLDVPAREKISPPSGTLSKRPGKGGRTEQWLPPAILSRCS